MDKTLEFGYTNYKGQYSARRVVPQHIYFGETEFHGGAQWILRGFDVDKQAYRDFAMKDMVLGEAGKCPCAILNKCQAKDRE